MFLWNYPLVPTILLLKGQPMFYAPGLLLRFPSEATEPAGSLSDHTNHIFVVGATSGSTRL